MGTIRSSCKRPWTRRSCSRGKPERNGAPQLLEEAEASFEERLSLYKSQKSGLEEQIRTLQAASRAPNSFSTTSGPES
jgi:hypothetical protein